MLLRLSRPDRPEPATAQTFDWADERGVDRSRASSERRPASVLRSCDYGHTAVPAVLRYSGHYGTEIQRFLRLRLSVSRVQVRARFHLQLNVLERTAAARASAGTNFKAAFRSRQDPLALLLYPVQDLPPRVQPSDDSYCRRLSLQPLSAASTPNRATQRGVAEAGHWATRPA